MIHFGQGPAIGTLKKCHCCIPGLYHRLAALHGHGKMMAKAVIEGKVMAEFFQPAQTALW